MTLQEALKNWKPPFQYDEEGTMIVDCDYNKIIDMRGWGYLTGQGALGLKGDTAADIQDTVAEAIVGFLNDKVKSNE